MRPLQSIDYLSLDNIDTILDILINQIDFIGQESIIPDTNLNYPQLKHNIQYMKSGFERIEVLLRQDQPKRKRLTKPIINNNIQLPTDPPIVYVELETTNTPNENVVDQESKPKRKYTRKKKELNNSLF